MMNNMMNVTHEWMMDGMWLWALIGVLLIVLPMVVIIKLSKD
ncbi:hypothetical protein [Methylomonas lenta]|nr:hypothetical protein [Methylomonas lenta]